MQRSRRPKKSASRCAHETGTSSASVLRILKTAELKCCVIRLSLHVMVETGPDQSLVLRVVSKADTDKYFSDVIICFD